MPQNEPRVIRVVSTNINAKGNPIKPCIDQRGISLPFLIGQDGPVPVGQDDKRDEAFRVAFRGQWDVMIIQDQQYTGLPDNLEGIVEATDLLWLVHADENTLTQESDLKKIFGRAGLDPILIPFHHDNYHHGRYLELVVDLCSTSRDYAENLRRLDVELRAEWLEAEVCAILWLLACDFAQNNDQAYQSAVSKAKELKRSLDAESATDIEEALEDWDTALESGEGQRTAYAKLKNTFAECLERRSRGQFGATQR